MKANTLKKSLCAALTAIMAVLSTSCGSMPESPTYDNSTEGKTTTTTAQPAAKPVEESKAETDDVSSAAEPEPSADTPDEPEPSADTPDVDEGFTGKYKNYCADVFKNVCLDEIKAGKNVMISPESIALALALAENGAEGETLAQMETLLGGSSIGEQNKAFGDMIKKAEDSEKIKFGIANSVWVKEGVVKLSPDYLENVQGELNAECYDDPFDPGAADRINNWVSGKTDGMIPTIIPPDAINDLTRAVLVNAICFEAEWSKEYDEDQISEDREFTSADGKKQKCTMLCSEEKGLIRTEGAKGFIKNYKGGEYAFVGLLPDDGTTAADFAASLDGEKLARMWAEKTHCDVEVEMPEFTSDYDIKLNDPLKAMGMTDAFDGNKADFSKMCEGGEDFSISQVIHKTHIEVDRKGTKAAAATAIIAETNDIDLGPEEYITLDRPFVYMIVDTESGTPVFMGVVNTLE